MKSNTLGVVIGRGKISDHVPLFLGFLTTQFIQLNREQFDQFLNGTSSDHNILETLELIATQSRQGFWKPEAFQAHQITKIIFFLAVQDGQILSVYEKLKHALLGQSSHCSIEFVHFSGAAFYSGIVGIHPLMTFIEKVTYTHELYENMPLCCDNLDWIKAYPQNLKSISPESKTLYHAFCVMLGNFPQLLVHSVGNKLPSDFEIQDFKYLIQHSVENVLRHGKSGLTGPHIRKDVETIKKHQAILKDTEAGLIYEQLSGIFFKELEHV